MTLYVPRQEEDDGRRIQYIIPRVIEDTPTGERVYDVYSRLLKDRIIFLGQTVTDELASVLTAQLLFLSYEDPDREIAIYINSPGGSITAGLAVYDTMQFIPNPITTLCLGMAASMATLLLCAGTKGHRFALPNSVIHQHPAGVGGIRGYAPDIEIQAKFLLDTERRTLEIMAKHTGQSYEKLRDDYQRDRFMSAQEAAEYGWIDAVLPTAAALPTAQG